MSVPEDLYLVTAIVHMGIPRFTEVTGPVILSYLIFPSFKFDQDEL